MTRPANGRAHLSIGEVLSLLQDEFPDVTISKIRFLESQGLLDPERTPSGYRKFYDEDIDRLRWILRQQKDHYLPLKVIKDRLDAGEHISLTSNGHSEGGQGALPLGRAAVAVSERVDTRPVVARPPAQAQAQAPAPAQAPQPRQAPSQAGSQAASQQAQQAQQTRRTEAPAARQQAPTQPDPAARQAQPQRPQQPSRNRLTAAASAPAQAAPHAAAPVAQPTGASRAGASPAAVSLSIEELAEASGLAVRDIRDLERFGLIEARETGGSGSYDGDALVVAQTAAGFLQHGIEARHMRTYKVAIDREAGLFEQIVSPVLKQRNPEARTRAARTVTELIRLGEVMRGVLLRRELRDLLGGSGH